MINSVSVRQGMFGPVKNGGDCEKSRSGAAHYSWQQTLQELRTPTLWLLLDLKFVEGLDI